MHGARLFCTWRIRHERSRGALSGFWEGPDIWDFRLSHMATVYITPYGRFVAAIHLDTSYTPRPPHELGIIRGLGLSQSPRDP
jgi:hypothetical protein